MHIGMLMCMMQPPRLYKIADKDIQKHKHTFRQRTKSSGKHEQKHKQLKARRLRRSISPDALLGVFFCSGRACKTRCVWGSDAMLTNSRPRLAPQLVGITAYGGFNDP